MNDQRFLNAAAKLADFVFVCAGVAFLLAFSYFFYYYGLTGQRQFASWKGVAVNYVSPILLAALSFMCLWLPATRKVNLATLAFTTGASIVAVETLLTVWFSLPSVTLELDQAALTKARTEAAKAQGTTWDARSKLEVVRDLRSEGVDAVPAIYPQGLLAKQADGSMKSLIQIDASEILPLAGISNKVAVVCNENGQYVTHRTDEHGFNNPPHLWDLPSFEIAAIGDSFVQVWCVPTEKHLTTLIRNRYPSTLNLGIEGDGPLAMLATIKEYAWIVKPKLLLWFYCEANDIADLELEQASPLLMRYLTGKQDQKLFVRQSEIDNALLAFLESSNEERPGIAVKLKDLREILGSPERRPVLAKSIVRLAQLRQGLGLVQGTGNEVAVASVDDPVRTLRMVPLLELFESTLLEAKSTVNGWGGDFRFVYLPDWHRYAEGQEGNPERDAVLKMVHSLNIPLIDVHQAFIEHKDPVSLYPFRQQGHYTEEGNRIAADYVLRSIAVE